MILVTGATGFIGQVLLRHLAEAGLPTRILLRPGQSANKLPLGESVEVVVCSLAERDSLRAAMVDVDIVYHLAGSEWRGARGNAMETDVMGTLAICQAAADAKIQRIFFLSHLGVDRLSVYHLLRAKAIAEGHIRQSGVPYTILRCGPVFGPGDHFTTGLIRLFKIIPLVVFLPGGGEELIQPLWVEDLATCLVWALDLPDTINQTISIGGPEFMPFHRVVDEVLHVSGTFRLKIPVHARVLHYLTVWLEEHIPNLPVNVNWVDYLANSHSTSLDTINTTFHLIPSKFSQRLDYLRKQ